MEEKGTDTNRHRSLLKPDSNLYLFDEFYYQQKRQKKGLRCRSAFNQQKLPYNINDNKILAEIIAKRNKLNTKKYFFFHNELETRKKNNSYNSELVSSKSRNKLNSNVKTINLSGIFKSNDSKIKLDTTKQSTKPTRFSAKYSSNYSYYKINNSSKIENNKLFRFKRNKNFVSVINLRANNLHKNKQILKKQTLNDITLQKLTNKLKSNKINKRNKNKYNSEKTRNKFYEIYPSLNADNINYKVEKVDYKIHSVLNRLNKDECKNPDLNKQNNYPIKYSFFQNSMNNILRRINFVDIEKDEQSYQNVLIDFQNKNKMKLEDFKTTGYELNPEELYIINQSEKQKLLKEKYEKLKQNYKLENLQKIEANKLLKEKTKKIFIPEYKLKFKNENWKNIKYESIYKYKPSEYSPIIKRKTFKRKNNFIKHSFDITKMKRNKSTSFSPKKTKTLKKINKKSKNKRDSTIYKIDAIKNTHLKQILSNNIKKDEINYENIFNKFANQTKFGNKTQPKNQNKNKIIDESNRNNSLKKENNSIEVDKSNIIHSNNSKSKKIENNANNNDNFTNSIIDMNHINSISQSSSLVDSNTNKVINQKEKIKDYNKVCQIERVASLILKPNGMYEFETLNLSDYIEKIKSKRKFGVKYSFECLTEKKNALNTQKRIKKHISNMLPNKLDTQKIKLKAKRKSVYIPIRRMLTFQKKHFKGKEENKLHINKTNEEIIPSSDKRNKEEDSNSDNNSNIQEKTKFLEEYEKYKEKRKNEKIINKKIIDKIDNYNLKKRQTYTPFYHTHFSRNEGFNKIELNFVSSKKDNNNKTTLDNMDRKRKNKILAQKASLDLLNNSDEEEEEESSEVEEKPNKTVKEIKNKERFSFAVKRRKSKKSTLNYISNKYKELEEKKDAVDINKELINTSNKYQIFTNVNLESVEDIEYNKSVLLFKLREDIKFKISQGKCEMNELDEFSKFENRLNEYKINYNLKDAKKIKEYALLLLTKFNEYLELSTIREKRKTEETRVNKFMNDLNFELDFNIPMSRLVKGRKCSARNFNQTLSRLSEIKK